MPGGSIMEATMTKRDLVIGVFFVLFFAWHQMAVMAEEYDFKEPHFEHIECATCNCPSGYDKMDSQQFKFIFSDDTGYICAKCPDGYYFGSRGSRGTWCMKYKELK